MGDFLKFYDSIKSRHKWRLEIYHSSIVDWSIIVEYGSTHPKENETIIRVQDCDLELALAKAQVELKEWLRENEDGY